jgi:hypothetical protein
MSTGAFEKAEQPLRAASIGKEVLYTSKHLICKVKSESLTAPLRQTQDQQMLIREGYLKGDRSE